VTAGFSLEIDRVFAAPIERVFDAWTSPEVMRRWFHCRPDWETPVAEVDLRVGGRVQVVMRRPDGTEVEAHGDYLTIDRPHRLVMTWTFSEEPDNPQLVELTFSAAGDSTRVRLINRRIATDARRDAQTDGWHGCLDELERGLPGWP
jgi:uncharacterized protein YndB with AHSA1/START domain